MIEFQFQIIEFVKLISMRSSPFPLSRRDRLPSMIPMNVTHRAMIAQSHGGNEWVKEPAVNRSNICTFVVYGLINDHFGQS